MVTKLYTKPFLQEVRRKALRKRVWFSALAKIDRGIFNLSCSIMDRIVSPKLCSQLMKIITRLREALEGDFVKMLETIGIKRAYKLSNLAQSWGYGNVKHWLESLDFARYLTMLEFHAPPGYGN